MEEAEGVSHYTETPLSYFMHSQGIKLKSLDDLKKSKYSDMVAKHVKGLVDKSREHKRRVVEPCWLENLYMTYGAQNIEQDDRGRWAPRDLAEDERRIRNFMLQRASYVVAQFLKVKPIWDVTDLQSKPEGTARAKRSAKMLQAEYHRHDLLVVRLMLAWSEVIFGSSIGKSYYDKQGGAMRPKKVQLREGDGSPVLDENGEPAFVIEGYERTGDIVEAEVLPFFFHVPLSAQDPLTSHCAWLAEDPPVHLQDIYRRWRFMAKPDVETTYPIMRLAADFTRFAEGLEVAVPATEVADMATVIEYHEKPSDFQAFEGGIVLQLCNDEVMDVGPQQLPPDFDDYCYNHYCYIPRKNQFWGHSLMTELKGAQRDLNEDRRSLAIARDMGALPPIMEPIGCSIPEGAFIRGAPRRIKFTNQEPKVMQGFGQLNQALIIDSQENEKDMDRIAPVTAPPLQQGAMGKSPWSREALEFMREQQETTMQPSLFLAINAFSKWGRVTLQLMRDHMPGDRLFVLQPDSGDVMRFMASRNDIPESSFVQVQEASALPLLKAALRNEVLNNTQIGLYGSPEEMAQDPILRMRILRHMQSPIPQDLMPPEQVDWENALQEAEDLLLMDQPPMPHPMEDMATHLRAHRMTVLHPSFKSWPPESQKLMMQHIKLTEALNEQKTAGQQKQQFVQQIQMATTEMVSRGKVRDAEALLLAVQGLLEHYDKQQAEGQQKQQQAQQQQQGAMSKLTGR